MELSDIVTNFGDGPVRDSGPGGAGAAAGGEDDFDPFDEARMVAATVDGLRVASVYVPNGRVVDSPFYLGKLAWLDRLARWLREPDALDPDAPHGGSFVIGGDFNVAPADIDVWDAAAAHGGTHVSERERAAVATLMGLGLPMPTAPGTPRRAATRGGTTGPACSTGTSACGSTCCSPPLRWPLASWGPRSIEKRARDPRPVGPRPSSSTSTSPAARSIPAGRGE